MAIRTKTHKLIYFYGCNYDGKAYAQPELYDLTEDPQELNNVYDHADYAVVRDHLKSQLASLRLKIGTMDHTILMEKVVQEFWDYDLEAQKKAIRLSRAFLKRREAELESAGKKNIADRQRHPSLPYRLIQTNARDRLSGNSFSNARKARELVTQ